MATFQLVCRATGTVTLADLAVVADLVKKRVGASVRTGYSLLDASVTSRTEPGTLQGAALVLPVTVVGMQVPTVDLDQLRAAIKGKSVDEARAYLSQFGQVDISMFPGWSSTMPSWDFRIDIQVIGPAGSAASPSGGVTAAPPTKAPAGPPSHGPSPAPSTSGQVTPTPSQPTPSSVPSAAPTASPSASPAAS